MLSQSTPLKFCNLHPDNKIQFFASEQPWIKLCRQCALNMALVGKKIDRDLTAGEFENKIAVKGLIEEVKETIQNCQKEAKKMGDFGSQFSDFYEDGIRQQMQQVDEVLKEVLKVKDTVYNMYEQHIASPKNYFNDEQHKFMMDSISLRRHLENMEMSYYDLIVNVPGEKEQFQRHLNLVKEDVARVKQNIYSKKENHCQKIDSVKEIFDQKFDELRNKEFILFKKQKVSEPINIKQVSVQAQTNRQTFKSRQSSHKYLSVKNLLEEHSEKKSQITYCQSQPNRIRLTLRSNSRKVSPETNSNRSTFRKSRHSAKGITSSLYGQ